MKTKVPFVGASYEARSKNVDAQRAINCFVEMDNNSPRAPMALYGTAGLKKLQTLPKSGCLAALVEGGYIWAIYESTVYRIDSSYNYVSIGKISSSSSACLASNGNQIIIVDGVGGYIIDVKYGTLTNITSASFPSGVTRVTYQDGYFAVAGNGTQKFYISKLSDGSSWNGLDYASAEGSPDNTIGIISDHRELWLFGKNSTEIWVNTGNATFPFERTGNAFIEQGCASGASVAKIDNSVFWLGSDDRGDGIVYRANGYTPQRISTHALEFAIQSYSVISDAMGFTYQQEGHSFYVLTFPTASKTWVYDISTGVWHERAYMNQNTGVLSRWRVNCHVMFNGMNVVFDYANGKMYQLDMDTYTEDGDYIYRLRSSIDNENMQDRVFYELLEIDLETGVGLNNGQGITPLLMMRYSNDGGHSWSSIKTEMIGAIGQYSARCRYKRLGTGRNRVWEISMTDPVKFVVMGANVRVK
jgi:hypothetical protein